MRRVTIFLFSTLVLLCQLSGCLGPYIYTRTNKEVQPRLGTDTAVMADGYTLPYVIFTPQGGSSRAVVLALHGFNDYRNAFHALGEFLAGENITLVAYDQRGFGETEGRGYWHGTSQLTKDLLVMVHLLQGRYKGVPLFLLGDSMGGAVLLAAMPELRNNGGIAGTILVAPAVWARKTMPWYQRSTLWFFTHFAPWFELSGRGLNITPSDNVQMLRALGRDPLVLKGARADTINGLVDLMDQALGSTPLLFGPVLILYGRHDEIVPPRPICAMLDLLATDNMAEWRFVLYTTGYHMLLRDLHAATVYRDIAVWIDDLLAAPDRGLDGLVHGVAAEDREYVCE